MYTEKEKYISAEMAVTMFECEDVITASDPLYTDEEDIID